MDKNLLGHNQELKRNHNYIYTIKPIILVANFAGHNRIEINSPLRLTIPNANKIAHIYTEFIKKAATYSFIFILNHL